MFKAHRDARIDASYFEKCSEDCKQAKKVEAKVENEMVQGSDFSEEMQEKLNRANRAVAVAEARRAKLDKAHAELTKVGNHSS